MNIDIRVMEMLASKFCHDLVSPVSAINNGVELIEDIGDSVTEEAMSLISSSATTAARRLKLFRMAYGRAGSEERTSLRDIRQVADQYLQGTKISLIWPDDAPDVQAAEMRGFLKVVLNTIMLAEESLAYGGVITVRGMSGSHRSGCVIEAAGRNAALTPAMHNAVVGNIPVHDLTPRLVQGYLVYIFAEYYDLSLSIDQSDADRLGINLYAVKEETLPEALVETPFVSVF